MTVQRRKGAKAQRLKVKTVQLRGKLSVTPWLRKAREKKNLGNRQVEEIK